MWLKQFQIAIIEKDVTTLIKLMDDIPTLEENKDIDSAICLLEEARYLVTSLKDETQKSMIQIQNNLRFLKVTEEKKTSSFDVKS